MHCTHVAKEQAAKGIVLGRMFHEVFLLGGIPVYIHVHVGQKNHSVCAMNMCQGAHNLKACFVFYQFSLE